MSKTHFDRLTMMLRSASFVTSNLIRSKNAVNFVYIIYLCGRAEKIDAADLERLVRRWPAHAWTLYLPVTLQNAVRKLQATEQHCRFSVG